MGEIAYFLAKRQGVSREDLERFGLAGVSGGMGPQSISTSKGPSGQGGVLLSFSKETPRPSTAREWRKAVRGDFWLGFDPEDPPGPEDLARPRQVAGHLVTMRGGGQWMIPVARSFPIGTALPQIIVLDESGKVTTETVPEYVDVSRKAERIWSALSQALADCAERRAAGEEDAQALWSISLQERFEIAVEALSVNYRVEADEVSLLKIMEDAHQDQILHALIDWPTVEQWAKKNSLPESSPTTDGEAANSGTTGPPSATSKSSGER